MSILTSIASIFRRKPRRISVRVCFITTSKCIHNGHHIIAAPLEYAQYDVLDLDQCQAMHRSDYPGTHIISMVWAA